MPQKRRRNRDTTREGNWYLEENGDARANSSSVLRRDRSYRAGESIDRTENRSANPLVSRYPRGGRIGAGYATNDEALSNLDPRSSPNETKRLGVYRTPVHTDTDWFKSRNAAGEYSRDDAGDWYTAPEDSSSSPDPDKRVTPPNGFCPANASRLRHQSTPERRANYQSAIGGTAVTQRQGSWMERASPSGTAGQSAQAYSRRDRSSSATRAGQSMQTSTRRRRSNSASPTGQSTQAYSSRSRSNSASRTGQSMQTLSRRDRSSSGTRAAGQSTQTYSQYGRSSRASTPQYSTQYSRRSGQSSSTAPASSSASSHYQDGHLRPW